MKSLLISAALVIGLVGISTSSAPASGPVVVKITGFAFSPATITITKGEAVEWINEDDAPHTVTSNTGIFKSPTLNKGQSFRHTFATDGAFPYYCTFHRGMKATVDVK